MEKNVSGERQLYLCLLAGRLIQQDELAAVFPSELRIGIEQFNTIHRSVGSQINIQFVADVNGPHLCRLGMQPDVSNVMSRIVAKLHCDAYSSLSTALIVPRNDRNHKPVLAVSHNNGLYFLCGIELFLPGGLEPE